MLAGRKFGILLGLCIALAVVGAGLLVVATIALVNGPEKTVSSSGTAAIGGPFTLVSTTGETVTDRTYLGKWQLMFFGYTFCPDACPTTLNGVSVALEKLGSVAANLQPIFVTVDPKRDTRETMAEYLKSFDSRIVGLTGTQSQIDGIVKEYRVYVAQQAPETTGDDYLVSHSSYIYLIDPRGKFVNVIAGTEPGDEIAAWLRKQMASTKG